VLLLDPRFVQQATAWPHQAGEPQTSRLMAEPGAPTPLLHGVLLCRPVLLQHHFRDLEGGAVSGQERMTPAAW
jgi:hypothetical protein